MGLKLDALERELRSADPRREKEAQKTLVKRVCPELGWLREYVVLNYTAVVKAVKKGNKNLGHTTHAVQLLAPVDAWNRPTPHSAQLVSPIWDW